MRQTILNSTDFRITRIIMCSILAERNYKSRVIIVNVMSPDFHIDMLPHIFTNGFNTLEFNWIYFRHIRNYMEKSDRLNYRADNFFNLSRKGSSIIQLIGNNIAFCSNVCLMISLENFDLSFNFSVLYSIRLFDYSVKYSDIRAC